MEITDDILAKYKNQGGNDLLGRCKDQIKTQEQVFVALATCNSLNLSGLVVVGGVDSNTIAARLAEKFADMKCKTMVVGVPVTLYGDLRNDFVETNVGFDTICKVNSQLISEVCTKALSQKKDYHFIQLMGRRASHVALECTLQSLPNMVILGEEVAASKLTPVDLVKKICDAVEARAAQDKYHGVILLPGGLIESIPELLALLKEIGTHQRDKNESPQLSLEAYDHFKSMQVVLDPESDESAQLLPEVDDSGKLYQI